MFDNLTSNAIREYADRKAALVEQRNAFADKTREHIAGMNMADIKAALDADAERGRIGVPYLTGKETKSALVDAAVEAYADASEAGETLTRLTRAAAADRKMAERLNQMILAADRALLTLTHEVDKSGEPVRLLNPSEVAYKLRWNYGDDLRVVSALADQAHGVVRAVENGYDVREVAAAEAEAALRTIMLHAGDATEQDKVSAAKKFIGAVGKAYTDAQGDDMMFTLARIAWM